LQHKNVIADGEANGAVAETPAAMDCTTNDVPTKEASSGQLPSEAPEVKRVRQSLLPPKVWVLRFGAVLAFCAGSVDAIGFLTLGAFTSHVTGTAAKIGLRLEGVTFSQESTHFELRQAILLLASFITGSFLCGFIISKNEVHFGKALYGVALMGNSTLLVASVLLGGCLGHEHLELASYCTAAACGLQNGMCTMHFGAVVRTTHVTGLATDFGLTLGRVAAIFFKRGCTSSRFDVLDKAEIDVDTKKLQVYVSIGLAFLIGVVVGAFIENSLGLFALLLPASITGLGGLGYTFFRGHLKHWFREAEVKNLSHDIEEVDRILERTRSYLHHWQGETIQHHDADASGRGAEDLDGQMGHALEVLHDLEASLAHLYETDTNHSSPKSYSRHSPCTNHSSPKMAAETAV
jgi:uncharacterized membrane protein YoaK (UPF0700 family)